ncbi:MULTISPECIES: prepilin-type N-terminal cleavage/methylation domain-containing protein [unclassified Variovorax]|uniref:prepilin-type N-terminal cleavage/methylation domain-containing protein n=1 Tax=unclassified Variovorax TaxID=663243 RepID=UPI0008CC6A3C|nr:MULTISPECIES: prepilin-type N-terminal cleavage/methylation domain-containing protein [unclassified Variovorax]SEK14830.1 general secretion pathway protein J [Variovorax sp. OK202]SFE04481.1 general secretion pathway protein J [Variovorax sp. OK212]
MRRRTSSGFTLIEVMIAIGLMAVLSLMAWRGLDGVSRANHMLEERTDRIARLMRALDQLERDVALRATTEIVARRAPTEMPARPAELLPPALQVRRQTELPLFLEIVRAAPAAPGQWQRVQWWHRGGALYRAAGAASASFPLPVPPAGAGVVVLEDVTAFELRAWEPGEGQGQGWRHLPAVAPAQGQATGLELSLSVRGIADSAPQRFRRVFVLE